MKIRISDIKNTKPQREQGNIKEFAENIQKEGLLQPVVINQENELICGRRRYEAIKLLKWDEVDVYRINTRDDIDKLSKAIAENIYRKQLTWQEEVKANDELRQLKEAKYGKAIQGERTDIKPRSPDERSSIRVIAKETKQSIGKLSQDLQLAEAIKEHPELEKIGTKQGALRELKLMKQKETIKTLKTPKGLYDVIVIDPPWETMSSQPLEYHPKGRRCVPAYPTMSIEQIKAIKIPSNKDCILWCWTINSRLHDAMHIVEDWGFERKNILTWKKDTFGLGEWLRGQTEHCILATKGKPVFDGKKYGTIIEGKRTTHSTKPDEFYQLVENTCFGKKFEYFSRRKRDGWEGFGDELQ